MLFWAVILTPYLIMWWSNLKHKLAIPKQMYLLPMKTDERKEYLRSLKTCYSSSSSDEFKDKFTYNDELPIVDGAAAFFPMYSSFVEAMYPSNIGKLNQQGSPYLYNNTPTGYMNLAFGYIDIMFGVYPSEEQIERVKANQGNLELIPYATDAFVFFVINNEFFIFSVCVINLISNFL